MMGSPPYEELFSKAISKLQECATLEIWFSPFMHDEDS